MIEQLIALLLPPGFRHHGTTYQSKGRWHTGNGIRFHQKTIQPIGGWVRRTLTGATIQGTPNAAIAWQTNSGASFLAVGTTTGCYVVSSGNVVTNIWSGVYAGAATTYTWQFQVYGSYLIACLNETNNESSTAIPATANVFFWNGDTATTLDRIVSSTRYVPCFTYGVVTTPERFLFLLRGSDPIGAVGFGPSSTGGYPVVDGRVS